MEAERSSPPGQVYVWTVNARQQIPVDLQAFRRIYELVKAVRNRPTAFDGGISDATAMPDVMIFNEMRQANIEVFRRLLDQRSKFDYEIVSAEGAEDKFLYNAQRLTPQGLAQTIVDPCRAGGENARQYLLQRFTENATATPITIVGVHFKARYDETGQPQCRERNVQSVKTALTADVGAVVVGGDFNKRPVEIEGACDPNEESPSLEWYSIFTEPSDLSRAFTDVVRDVHRSQNESMNSEWTFERLTKANLCDNRKAYKRSRLDYIFTAGTTVADAHADHPGWSTDIPGQVPFGKERYSDHRWVWARLILAGPPRPRTPALELGVGGTVQLTWEPVEGATGYVVYRGKKWHSYEDIAVVPPDQTTYTDKAKHGISYRYSIAAVGADTSQGRESPGERATPDARGPRVTATNPPNGAPSVDPRKRVRVWFGEGVAPSSVNDSTIRVFRNGNKVPGRLILESSRQISFNPSSQLRKGNRYYVVVRSVTDRLGNRGPRHTFSFSTPAPPPKKGPKGGR
jgi:endonuclease/exonuclease/phosphatase family metal-dependent hydrolase